ncbi:MAG: hypothetical protein DI629_08100 [Mesorhizobium amorphae]|nr:MAG: hypothetical protein DI629_08100 [Mesorhizobium amorphae]
MNTANLQLEGLYLALASVLSSLKRQDVLSGAKIDAALAEAERCAASGEDGRERSLSNTQAVLFPIRLLRLANAYDAGELPPFSELAAKVSLHNHQNEERHHD